MIRNHQEKGNLEMIGLERRIYDYIECKYKCCFTGGVSVEKHNNHYCLKLELDSWQVPLWICSDSKSDNDFFCFAKTQIDKRELIRTEHYKVVLENGGQK